MDEKAVEAEVLDESKEIKEIARILAEKTGISMWEAMCEIMNAMQWRVCDFEKDLAALNDLLRGCPVQAKSSSFSANHAEREKRKAVEQSTAHHFHQYKGRENAWNTKKRTGRRRREWRGPWKEN